MHYLYVRNKKGELKRMEEGEDRTLLFSGRWLCDLFEKHGGVTQKNFYYFSWTHNEI